jgi:hypothetical protein
VLVLVVAICSDCGLRAVADSAYDGVGCIGRAVDQADDEDRADDEIGPRLEPRVDLQKEVDFHRAEIAGDIAKEKHPEDGLEYNEPLVWRDAIERLDRADGDAPLNETKDGNAESFISALAALTGAWKNLSAGQNRRPSNVR